MDILEELRKLRVGPKTVTDQGDSNTLQFGTLPAVSSPIRMPTITNILVTLMGSEAVVHGSSVDAEMVVHRASPGFPLNLPHNEVILSLNSELKVKTTVVGNAGVAATSGAMVCRDKPTEMMQGRVCPQNRTSPQTRANENVNPSSSGSQFYHTSPTYYYQHTDFGSHPFNSFVGSIPYSLQNQDYFPYHSASGAYAKQHDPYMMTYSSPYYAVSTALPSMPTPTLPFAVPTYLNAQAQPFVCPTFATTTMQHKTSPWVTLHTLNT